LCSRPATATRLARRHDRSDHGNGRCCGSSADGRFAYARVQSVRFHLRCSGYFNITCSTSVPGATGSWDPQHLPLPKRYPILIGVTPQHMIKRSRARVLSHRLGFLGSSHSGGREAKLNFGSFTLLKLCTRIRWGGNAIRVVTCAEPRPAHASQIHHPL
jgi:hypothetical protein